MAASGLGYCDGFSSHSWGDGHGAGLRDCSGIVGKRPSPPHRYSLGQLLYIGF